MSSAVRRAAVHECSDSIQFQKSGHVTSLGCSPLSRGCGQEPGGRGPAHRQGVPVWTRLTLTVAPVCLGCLYPSFILDLAFSSEKQSRLVGSPEDGISPRRMEGS